MQRILICPVKTLLELSQQGFLITFEDRLVVDKASISILKKKLKDNLT